MKTIKASEFLSIPSEALPGARSEEDEIGGEAAWSIVRRLAASPTGGEKWEAFVTATSSRWIGTRRIIAG